MKEKLVSLGEQNLSSELQPFQTEVLHVHELKEGTYVVMNEEGETRIKFTPRSMEACRIQGVSPEEVSDFYVVPVEFTLLFFFFFNISSSLYSSLVQTTRRGELE